MKIKISNLLMVIIILSFATISSCKKDEEDKKVEETKPETGSFTDSRDNRTYKWVKIGNQVWMAENLAYTGSEIIHKTKVTDWIDINAGYNGWCYYDNNTSNGEKYGVLYQWEAAKKACPSGWHLPTQAEWVELITYLTDNGYSYDGYTGVADISKSLASDKGWAASNEEGAIGNSDYPEVRNKTGFTALPAGHRTSGGTFRRVLTHAYWWTATEYAKPSAYYHTINNVQPYESYSNENEGEGLSVRCVRD
jgi:uncharacterized protein (TIGR02145 family)